MATPSKKRHVSVDPNRLRLTDEGGAAGALLGVRCRDCGTYSFGALAFCQACTSANVEHVELSSAGSLYSYTIVWVPPSGWPGPVPYVLGQIELPEGPHVLAEVVDCPRACLKVGMPVELALRTVDSAESDSLMVVYKWRPAPPA